MDVIFLDTETSGADTSKNCIIQLAYKRDGQEACNYYFRADHPISFEAMAVCHITDEMIADAPVFAEHEVMQKLPEILDSCYLVAHNAEFDIRFLMREGIFSKKHICTLKVARRYCETDCRGQELSGHSLQYLRYALGLNDQSFQAHDALSDILLLEKLFHYQIDLVSRQLGVSDVNAVLEHMYEISQQPSLLKRIRFGKHRGMTYDELAQQHPDYLEWLLTKDDMDEDVKFTADYYLKLYYRK